MDRNHPGLIRGFAYIEYANLEDAEKALKYMDGGQIDGQEITVVKAEPLKIRDRGAPPPPPRRNAPWRPNSPPRRRGRR